MGNRKFLTVCAFMLSLFVACDDDYYEWESALPVNDQTGDTGDNENTEDVDSEDYVITIADALTENCSDHDDAGDYIWNSSEVVQIVLDGNSVTINGVGAIVDSNKVIITSAGTYSISGSLSDGQIVVNTEDKEIVRLILNGVDISSSNNAPVYVMDAKKTVIVLADNLENYVTDGESYIFENPEEDEPNAAIFSKDDLTIFGNGSLVVDANYNDGITSKDGLIIKSGTITVNSVDDGIRGKDYLIIKDGDITVNADGDGLKSDNDEDIAKGYVLVETGVMDITSGRDAIQAKTDVLISNGEILLTSGGGSQSSIAESESAKGIKAVVHTIIDGGNITVNSADDAIHSNQSMAINDGSFILSTGDDGMHADSIVGVNGGDIHITKSYEGIESAIITINHANLHIASSDDGINVVGDNDGSDIPGGPGGPGQGNFTSSGDYYLFINGGYIYIEAAGDGMDINGTIIMTGGDVIINGPVSNMNGALDYNGAFTLTGGFLVAAGSSGMAQAPGASSTQNVLLLNFNTSQQAGSLIHIQTSEGNRILTFEPVKKYQSIVFSSSELISDFTYDVYNGGSSTGTDIDGLYQDGTYTPGTRYTSFTVTTTVTSIGNTIHHPGGK